jgi:hypothetical protein
VVAGHQGGTIHYNPLDYTLWNIEGRLAMQIANPTEDKIVLRGDRGVVIDPAGESHPLSGRVIGPHSFMRMMLPPVPFNYAYPDYSWGWGWGPWGWRGYGPYYYPFYGPAYYGPPPLVHQEIYTAYDWQWKEGLVRLRLTYDRTNKIVEHELEIVRELKKD